MKGKDNFSKVLLIIFLVLLIVAIYLVINKGFNKEQTDIASTKEKATVATQPESVAAGSKGEEETENTQSELFYQYYEQAEALLKTMTLEEKVGQMFFAKYSEKEEVENPCGYIIEEKDLKNETKQTIKEKLTKIQEKSKIKLALAVNEEGGTAVSVSSNKNIRATKFNSPQELWKQGQIGLILKDSTEKTTLLKSLGINMNLVPVADIPVNNTDYIYERAYGRGVENTSTYVSQIVKTMNNDGMISTMKHFPGYGDNEDTQEKIVKDTRPYSTFENTDFLPFKSGIEAKVPTILINHNIVECMDKENPASLSKEVNNILRDELGFSGIIITDDLSKEAVKQYVENGNATIKAIQAGNDIIISSDLQKQKEEVVQAVNKQQISEDVINTAVKRILAWKYAYNII